jgi:hypothetical protein
LGLLYGDDDQMTWNAAQSADDKREKIHALSLAKECYSMKTDLLTNATVVDDAIRFVSQKSKSKSEEELNSSSSDNEHDREESNEPDYDEDGDQLEEEQEEQTGEVTTNQIFENKYDKAVTSIVYIFCSGHKTNRKRKKVSNVINYQY